MAQYCDHGGYGEHRMGDGECALCEDMAALKSRLQAAIKCIESADRMRVNLNLGALSHGLAYDADRQVLRELMK